MKTNTAPSWRLLASSQLIFEPTRIYRAEDAKDILAAESLDAAAVAAEVDGKFIRAFVRAVEPADPKSCYEPTCCS